MPDGSSSAFACPITEEDGVLFGPFRSPKQMLAEQTYDGHASIHDDATAEKLGFKGGTIEGPTHFSQIVPLGHAIWGEAFLMHGAISAHFRNPAFEGDKVQAALRRPQADRKSAEIWMTLENGEEVLRGTASMAGAATPTALEARLASLKPLEEPVILADVKVGSVTPRIPVRLDPDQLLGDMYPFTLRQKLAKITEPSAWYEDAANPWGRPIVPVEMISVMAQYKVPPGSDFPQRMPSVSLYADQEIRLVDGPMFVGQDYEMTREALFLSGSRRTESLWIRARLYEAGTDREVAQMLLNMATLKVSYGDYEKDRGALYP